MSNERVIVTQSFLDTIFNLLILYLVAGSIALSILTAILVAWNAVRVRPLAILRYE